MHYLNIMLEFIYIIVLRNKIINNPFILKRNAGGPIKCVAVVAVAIKLHLMFI